MTIFHDLYKTSGNILGGIIILLPECPRMFDTSHALESRGLFYWRGPSIRDFTVIVQHFGLFARKKKEVSGVQKRLEVAIGPLAQVLKWIVINCYTLSTYRYFFFFNSILGNRRCPESPQSCQTHVSTFQVTFSKD